MSQSKAFVVNESAVPLEQWDDPTRGSVRWRTLISADRTPTDSLTMGVAEIEPGQLRIHSHAQPEAYYILSGQGVVTIDGQPHPVQAGSTVFIPGGAQHGAVNTGDELMRLLYVFAADSFDEIEYQFANGE